MLNSFNAILHFSRWKIQSPVKDYLRSIVSQEKKPGLLSFTASGVAFLSLQSISSAANEIISKHEICLLNTPDLSPGLKEQMKIQMEHLKDPNVPEIEIITNPVFGGFIGQWYFGMTIIHINSLSEQQRQNKENDISLLLSVWLSHGPEEEP